MCLCQARGLYWVSFDKPLRMDLDVIQRQSFWLDLRLLFQTPVSVANDRSTAERGINDQ
jgi:lipopolysaccharide/colanic/teichoic acid biosynthesis glycosyltransferase